MSFRGSGRSGGGFGSRGVPLDEAERRELATMARNLEMRPQTSGNFTASVVAGVSALVPGGVTQSSSSTMTWTASGSPPPPEAPVRVGSRIVTPKKVYDVPPVLPEIARQAGVRGVVILEVTVAADGSVAKVQVLRSIPLLDAAAVEAVRQWRYEPTHLNGTAVPIILTVPVPFQ
jgi:protein TonB